MGYLTTICCILVYKEERAVHKILKGFRNRCHSPNTNKTQYIRKKNYTIYSQAGILSGLFAEDTQEGVTIKIGGAKGITPPKMSLKVILVKNDSLLKNWCDKSLIWGKLYVRPSNSGIAEPTRETLAGGLIMGSG